jgi:hypothetical protein
VSLRGLDLVDSGNAADAFEQELAPAILNDAGAVVPKPNCSAKTVSDEEIGDPDWQVASGAFRTFRHELWHEASLSILRKLSRHGGWSDGGDSSSLRAEQMAAESSLAGVECSHLEVSVWDLFAAGRPFSGTQHGPAITRTSLLYVQLSREVFISYLF